MHIRQATTDDCSAISTLAHSIWHSHYPGIITVQQIDYMLSKMYSVEKLNNLLESGSVILVAEEDEILLGYICFREETENSFFLDKLYVDTALQHKNLGSLLLEAMLSSLPENIVIRLQVNRSNYKAINFYFKKGFVIERAEDFDIGNGYFMNDFVMIKK